MEKNSKSIAYGFEPKFIGDLSDIINLNGSKKTRASLKAMLNNSADNLTALTDIKGNLSTSLDSSMLENENKSKKQIRTPDTSIEIMPSNSVPGSNVKTTSDTKKRRSNRILLKQLKTEIKQEPIDPEPEPELDDYNRLVR